MNTKTNKLLSDLNEQLNFIELEIDNQLTRCESSIEIILKVLINLKNLISKFKFNSETEEIQFFKEIKPQFTSKIIYYNTIFNIEMKKPNGGTRVLKKYYNNELIKLKAFFDVLTPIKQESYSKFRLLIMRLIFSLKLDFHPASIFPLA